MRPRVFCSKDCYGLSLIEDGRPGRRNFPIGTARPDAEGYVTEKTPNGWQAQHRVVMERRLGRALLPGENVHHVNGVKDDNRDENLELWVTSQPKGQRVPDLVAWAREILARYADA
jgi:hypothetical protein